MADATTWIAAVGPIAGYVAGLATEIVRGYSESKTVRTEREALRQAELQDRRNAFEQETLAKLSDAIRDFLQAVEVMRRMQETAYQTTGSWTLAGEEQTTHHDGELTTRYHELTRHIDLVMDDNLREKITQFAERIWTMFEDDRRVQSPFSRAATGRRGQEEARNNARAAYQRVLDLYVKLQREIGRQRRELYLRGFERMSLEI